MLAAALCVAGLAACSGDGVTAAPTATGGGTARATATAGSTAVTPTGEPVPAVPGTPSAPPATSTPTQDGAAQGSLAGKVIVVDPGHNGGNAADPSAINRQVDAGGFRKACNTTGTAARGVTESSVNLQVAELLAQRLRSRGASVVMTRSDDSGVGPCIDERGLVAQRESADALVSIHADGAAAGQYGFHVISPGQVPGYTDGIVDPSRALAGAVRDALAGQGLATSTYAGSNGLVTRTDLGTLNRAGVPAVMVELGNMHNGDDFGRLTDSDGQSRYADGLAAGVAAYLS